VTDRRRIAAVLLVLGAGLAVVGTLQEAYRTLFRGYGGPDETTTTRLWAIEDPSSLELVDPPYAFGSLVVVVAVVMVVAAVLTLRNRTAFVARAVAMAAAGVLAGLVLEYWQRVLAQQATMRGWPAVAGQSATLEVLSGMYLVAAGAVAGLVGAVLAQRKRPEPSQEDQEDGQEVVVHQLDSADDTPPFGLAVPDAEQQETR
jgi:cytochrome bd-type quinol oxidase subunit 2